MSYLFIDTLNSMIYESRNLRCIIGTMEILKDTGEEPFVSEWKRGMYWRMKNVYLMRLVRVKNKLSGVVEEKQENDF